MLEQQENILCFFKKIDSDMTGKNYKMLEDITQELKVMNLENFMDFIDMETTLS